MTTYFQLTMAAMASNEWPGWWTVKRPNHIFCCLHLGSHSPLKVPGKIQFSQSAISQPLYLFLPDLIFSSDLFSLSMFKRQNCPTKYFNKNRMGVSALSLCLFFLDYFFAALLTLQNTLPSIENTQPAWTYCYQLIPIYETTYWLSRLWESERPCTSPSITFKKLVNLRSLILFYDKGPLWQCLPLGTGMHPRARQHARAACSRVVLFLETCAIILFSSERCTLKKRAEVKAVKACLIWGFCARGGRLSGISAIRDHACLTWLTGRESGREVNGS